MYRNRLTELAAVLHIRLSLPRNPIPLATNLEKICSVIRLLTLLKIRNTAVLRCWSDRLKKLIYNWKNQRESISKPQSQRDRSICSSMQVNLQTDQWQNIIQ